LTHVDISIRISIETQEAGIGLASAPGRAREDILKISSAIVSLDPLQAGGGRQCVYRSLPGVAYGNHTRGQILADGTPEAIVFEHPAIPTIGYEEVGILIDGDAHGEGISCVTFGMIQLVDPHRDRIWRELVDTGIEAVAYIDIAVSISVGIVQAKIGECKELREVKPPRFVHRFQGSISQMD
jgi:hypothetical protein